MRFTTATYLPISAPQKRENKSLAMTHGRENTPLLLAKQLHQAAANQGRSLTYTEKQTYDLAFAEAKGFAAGSAVVGIDRASLRPWSNGGEFLLAVRQAEISHRRNLDPRLSAQAAALGANETVEAEGGFLVPPQVSTKLIEKTYNVGAVVSRCDTVPMGSSRLTVPIADESSRRDGQRYGGVTVARTMEAGKLAASVLLTENLELTANKMMGVTVVTEELQDDLNALALNQWIKRAFPAEFSFQFDREALNGNGVGEFLGINNSLAMIVASIDAGQAAATLTATNIISMYRRLWAPSRPQAAWFVTQEAEEQLWPLLRIVGNSAEPLYSFPGSRGNDSPYGRMLGCPVIRVEQAAALGQQGDIVLADMSQYLIGNRSSRFDTSIHVFFQQGLNAYRWAIRNDGAPTWKAPLLPYNSTETKSPFVTLAARQ